MHFGLCQCQQGALVEQTHPHHRGCACVSLFERHHIPAPAAAPPASSWPPPSTAIHMPHSRTEGCPPSPATLTPPSPPPCCLLTCFPVAASEYSSSYAPQLDCRMRLSADQSRCVMYELWPLKVAIRL